MRQARKRRLQRRGEGKNQSRKQPGENGVSEAEGAMNFNIKCSKRKIFPRSSLPPVHMRPSTAPEPLQPKMVPWEPLGASHLCFSPMEFSGFSVRGISPLSMVDSSSHIAVAPQYLEVKGTAPPDSVVHGPFLPQATLSSQDATASWRFVTEWARMVPSPLSHCLLEVCYLLEESQSFGHPLGEDSRNTYYGVIKIPTSFLWVCVGSVRVCYAWFLSSESAFRRPKQMWLLWEDLISPTHPYPSSSSHGLSSVSVSVAPQILCDHSLLGLSCHFVNRFDPHQWPLEPPMEKGELFST